MNSEMLFGETIYTNLDKISFTNDISQIDKCNVYLSVRCFKGSDTVRYGAKLNEFHKKYTVQFHENNSISLEYNRGDGTITFKNGRPNGLVCIIQKKFDTEYLEIRDEDIKDKISEYLNSFMIDSKN